VEDDRGVWILEIAALEAGLLGGCCRIVLVLHLKGFALRTPDFRLRQPWGKLLVVGKGAHLAVDHVDCELEPSIIHTEVLLV